MKTHLIHISLLLTMWSSFFSCNYLNPSHILSADYPKNIENEIDTIEVTYIAWACACANWLPTKFLKDPNYISENAEDCIYIEASKKELKLPEKFEVGDNNNKIRLIGSFYKEEGISRDYISPTSQYPEKGKVFRYSNIEIIKPYTIWDFSTKEPTKKIIKKGTQLKFENK